MPLTNKEKAITLVANAIAVYSIATEKGALPKNQSLIDFILKSVTFVDLNQNIFSMIDDVFEYVSKTHLELS